MRGMVYTLPCGTKISNGYLVTVVSQFMTGVLGTLLQTKYRVTRLNVDFVGYLASPHKPLKLVKRAISGFRCQWPLGRGSSSLLLGTTPKNKRSKFCVICRAVCLRDDIY